jgi:hypothetical protein
MYNVEPSQSSPNVTSAASIQQSNAVLNMKLTLLCWWFIFSFAAVFQIALWPTSDNIACVLLAWSSCMATGVVMLRGRVTFLYPWSSLMVLGFCLSTCGLPVVLTLLQASPMTFNLEVPVATFSHLLICQILLLLIHAGYRNMKLWRRWEQGFRMKVLRPCGLLETPSWGETLAIGAVGLASSAYVYIVLRDQNAGTLNITGSAVDKFVQGLCPLTYAPFLSFFSNAPVRTRGGLTFRLGFMIFYSLLVFFIALAYNTREFAFSGFAIIGIFVVLLLLSGKRRLHLNKVILVGAIGLLLTLTIGSDVAVAIRVARFDRSTMSSLDIVKETIQLLTVNRDELNNLRDIMQHGNDESEAWYVTSPVLSRCICTQFQDQALAIGLGFSEAEKQMLRHVEFEHILTSLPNPALKMLSSPEVNLIDAAYDKDQVNVGGSSIGAWMLYLGGTSTIGGIKEVSMDETGKLVGEVFATGGFIGDGFAAYGWWYLLPFVIVAFLLFLFSDSLYGFLSNSSRENAVWESSFAMVGLVNGYALATALTKESIAAFIMFIVRQPLQWLVVYGVVFFVVRFVSRMFFGREAQTLQARKIAVEMQNR